MTTHLVLTGLLSHIPGIGTYTVRHANTAGRSPGYCYRVWHRHVLAYMNSGTTGFPKTVVELGPGGSVGVGLCAVLMGAKKYIGLDTVSRPVFPLPKGFLEELERLIVDRAPVGAPSWMEGDKGISARAIMDTASWQARIDPSRVRERRAGLEEWLSRDRTRHDKEPITYLAPWNKDSVERALGNRRACLVMSHSVLEYVMDLQELHTILGSVTSRSGRLTHHVDLGSLQSLPRWNEYWRYSGLRWKIMRGRRPYFPTRLPISSHLEAIRQAGLRVDVAVSHSRPSGLQEKDLHAHWSHLGRTDIRSSALFVVCSKRGESNSSGSDEEQLAER